VVAGEEERSAQALDLQRPRPLVPEALPDAVRREHDERDEHRGQDREQQPAADERLPSALALPDVGDRDRHEHRRVQLRGHSRTERHVPESQPPAEERGEGGRNERGGPEVEAREHDRAERNRGDGDEPERGEQPPPACAECHEGNGHADHDHQAEEGHLGLEPPPKRVSVRPAERR
jgi:hypothetical protein